MQYQIHPVANEFPLMSPEEFDALKEDIRQNGLRVPISLFRGQILDGRNRYLACVELEIEPKFEDLADLSEEDAINFSVSRNLQRRHLMKSQQAMFLVKSGLLKHQGANDTKRAYRTGSTAIRRISQRYGISHVSIYKAMYIYDHDSELAKDVLNGKLSVVKAENQIRSKQDARPTSFGRSRPKQETRDDHITSINRAIAQLKLAQAELSKGSDAQLQNVRYQLADALTCLKSALVVFPVMRKG